MRNTKLVYGNCLLGGMYLCLRGKAKKVGFVSSHAWYVPAHIVVETKTITYFILNTQWSKIHCTLKALLRVSNQVRYMTT